MFRPPRVLLLAILAGGGAVGACVGDDPTVSDTTDSGIDAATSGDDASIDAPAADTSSASDSGPKGPCNLEAPFGKPTAVAGLPMVNSVVRFSSDENTAYFALDPDGGNPQIYFAQRSDANSPFGAPVALAAVNDSTGESVPAISKDGLRLVYARGYPSATSRDLYYATRAQLDASFADPMPIGGGVNAPGIQDDYPSLQANDDLWFVSTRDGGDHDIFHAISTGGVTFGAIDKAVGVNAAAGDQYYPVVTADGLRIYFARAGIYTATRTGPSADFTGPTRVAEVDDVYPDARPSWVSLDGCRLYITTGAPQKAYVAAKPAN